MFVEKTIEVKHKTRKKYCPTVPQKVSNFYLAPANSGTNSKVFRTYTIARPINYCSRPCFKKLEAGGMEGK